MSTSAGTNEESVRPAQQESRAVGHRRTVQHGHVQVVLVAVGRREFDDARQEAGRGGGAHAADDSQLFHALSQIPSAVARGTHGSSHQHSAGRTRAATQTRLEVPVFQIPAFRRSHACRNGRPFMQNGTFLPTRNKAIDLVKQTITPDQRAGTKSLFCTLPPPSLASPRRSAPLRRPSLPCLRPCRCAGHPCHACVRAASPCRRPCRFAGDPCSPAMPSPPRRHTGRRWPSSVVRTSGPSSVMATVFSKCAEGFPSRACIPANRRASGASCTCPGQEVMGSMASNHPRLQLDAGVAMPVVGHVGVFVHVAADAMPHVLAHHAVAFRLGDLLNRPPRCRPDGCPDAQHRDRPTCTSPWSRASAAFRGRWSPRRRLHGVVAHPAVHHGAGVDGDDVALLEDHGGRRDAMDDLLVDRRADGAGEPAVSLERGHAAFQTDERLGELVELERRHARLHALAHLAQHFGRDAARFLHGLDLGRGLLDDHAPCTFLVPARCFAEQYSIRYRSSNKENESLTQRRGRGRAARGRAESVEAANARMGAESSAAAESMDGGQREQKARHALVRTGHRRSASRAQGAGREQGAGRRARAGRRAQGASRAQGARRLGPARPQERGVSALRARKKKACRSRPYSRKRLGLPGRGPPASPSATSGPFFRKCSQKRHTSLMAAS